MKIATICVSGVEAAALDRKSITMGLAGATVEFEYTDPMWSGLTKNVVFDGATTVAVYNAGTVVEVPSAVLAVKNTPVRVGVCGIGGDGSEVVPTIWAELGVVRSSAFGQFPPPAEVPLPVWAQVMALIGDLNKLTTDAKENLVAAINEAAASGGVDANTLQAAINAALSQAKASGEFDGEDGAPGKDGATYIPSVQDGYLSWRNEQGRPNPASSYIKGEPGKDGVDGKDGAPGKSAYQYAVDGGYTGTEAEFAELMANGSKAVQPDLAQNDSTQPDYVKNRTHWEEDSQTVIEWDGNTEGRESFNSPSGSLNTAYYKIADYTPMIDELIGGTITGCISNADNVSVEIFESSSSVENGLSLAEGMIYVVYEGNQIAVTPGIYALAQYIETVGVGEIVFYVSKLTYGSTTVHQIDEKFIPDTIARVKDIPTDEHINNLIKSALGVIENGTY